VWDTEKLKAAFPDIPKEYDSFCVEFKSDYARQRILYERGGMWLDADMFVVADLYESVLAHTWSYDQVQPLENNGCSSINICAMACRPKSQVFKKAVESVNAVMPLRIGWGDLLNTPTKYAIRESYARGLVKYIPELVVSLRFVQNPKGGFSEIYSSTDMSLDEIVFPETTVVTLHSSQIRHHQKDKMPKDYLLQRLIDKYLDEKSQDENHFDVVEIGTSDFSTEVQEDCLFLQDRQREGLVRYGGRILSVEPVKYYFDRLLKKEGCIREHAAVSNYEGSIEMWHVEPQNLVKYGFVSQENLDVCWQRGCNSVDGPHPQILRDFKSMKVHDARLQNLSILDVFNVQKVKCHSINSLFDKYGIKSLSYLKIDTEGHDPVILNDYFDYCTRFPQAKANWIRFEANELTPKDVKESLIKRASTFGYVKTMDTGYDIILGLELEFGGGENSGS